MWSSVGVAGVRVKEINPAIGTDEDPERWVDVHAAVVNSANEIIKRKGYTNTAIGLSCSNIVKSIFGNVKRVHSLSVYAKVSCYSALIPQVVGLTVI